MNRLNAVIKSKGITRKILMKRLGIKDYSSLKSLENNPTYNSAKRIADELGCELHELFDTSADFYHSYDEKGEWQGIRRK